MWLVWLRTQRAEYAAQIIYSGTGTQPFIDAGIKGNVVATTMLTDEDKKHSQDPNFLSIMQKKYPAPPYTERS